MAAPYGTAPRPTTTTQPRGAINPLYDTGGSSEMGGGGGSGGIGGPTGIPRPTPPPLNWWGGAAGTNLNGIGGTGGTTGGIQQFGAAPQSFGTPLPTGFPQDGTKPMTGWAKDMGYTQGDILGMNQMPARYLGGMLGARGQDPTGGLFYMMEPLADIMMPMMELIYGAGASVDPNSPNFGYDPNETANFMGNMFSTMATPGGRGFDIRELANRIATPGPEGSALGELFNQGTPEEQIENTRRYMMMLGQYSGSPAFQQALSNYMSRKGYDYLRGFEGGQEQTGNFAQSLGNTGMGG